MAAAEADILLRLDEESLRRDPEEVFDILEKLGEGSVVQCSV